MWPDYWPAKYPMLGIIQIPILSNERDELEWHGREGLIKIFSVCHVYETIRPTGNIVYWFEVVWHSNCIPRHAFILWLLMKQKLKTQDKLKDWEIRPDQNHDWSIVATYIVGLVAKKSGAVLVAKLLFAAAVYFIWQEKNFRLFNHKRRSAKELFGVIYYSVRLKLLSVHFKESHQIQQLRIAWQLE
ncbi:uncharacterized protein [Rutidosis leptorrhynchoides]|uniref:uncharacterized protein n=1 Tax=Rutidosis leptorrhynchoides TaxID=125765 RepID=UPI003A99D2CF